MNSLHLTRFASALLLATGLGGALAGCQSSGSELDEENQLLETPEMNLRAGIPPVAQQVGQESQSPSYTATERGVLYLYDRTANRLVETYNMREGQTLVVSAAESRAVLDGNEVLSDEIRRNRTYVLYFLPTRQARTQAGEDNTFRITPANP